MRLLQRLRCVVAGHQWWTYRLRYGELARHSFTWCDRCGAEMLLRLYPERER